MILYFIVAIIIAIITGITFSFSTKEHPVLFWLAWAPFIIACAVYSFYDNVLVLVIGVSMLIIFSGVNKFKRVLEDTNAC